MEDQQGNWIKLHRKIKNSKVWNYTDAQFKVWITILLSVNWNESYARVGSEVKKLNPGEMVTSRKHLAEQSGVSSDTAYRAQQNLEKDGLISVKPHSNGTFIKVNGWEEHQRITDGNKKQHNESYSESYSTPHNESYTHKEVKEVKEGKEDKPSEKKESEKDQKRKKEIQEIYDHWNKSNAGVTHRPDKPTTAIKKSVNARLKDYSVAELKNAIINLAKVLNDDKYWWTHKYTLKEFMSRQEGGRVDTFLEGTDQFLEETQKKFDKDKPIGGDEEVQGAPDWWREENKNKKQPANPQAEKMVDFNPDDVFDDIPF